jgi:ABC-type transport system involved in multi-copper enzyme maturation permease subunit
MRRLIHAELLKLRTTRMFYGCAAAALLFVPLILAISIQTAGHKDAGPALTTSEGIRNVMSAAASGTTIILIIGILIMAGEFRHNTATSTFLVTPDRKRLVGAKLIAATIVGAGLAMVASLVTLVVAVPWLAAKDIHVSILSADVGLVLLAAIAASALYAMVGVGVGSLIRNQTAAVVVALVWVMVVESLLVTLLPDVGRWLPGGAVAALTGAATRDGGLLPMWAGGLLFAAYGLGFAATGSRFVLRRDVA